MKRCKTSICLESVAAASSTASHAWELLVQSYLRWRISIQFRGLPLPRGSANTAGDDSTCSLASRFEQSGEPRRDYPNAGRRANAVQTGDIMNAATRVSNEALVFVVSGRLQEAVILSAKAVDLADASQHPHQVSIAA